MIKYLSHPLVKISLIHCQSQTERARELEFWENVHPTLCVTCHVSHVTCHQARVTCQLSPVRCIFLKQFLFKKKIILKNIYIYTYYPSEKNGQSGEASRWRGAINGAYPVFFLSVFLLQDREVAWIFTGIITKNPLTLQRLISSHHLDMVRLIGNSAYLILEGQICLLLC